ncbi:MAG: hypothetical protein K0R98_1306 [Rickettsiaceae bacterium]|nr:hypothetical protein [Rickettsiaceae bacterium]
MAKDKNGSSSGSGKERSESMRELSSRNTDSALSTASEASVGGNAGKAANSGKTIKSLEDEADQVLSEVLGSKKANKPEEPLLDNSEDELSASSALSTVSDSNKKEKESASVSADAGIGASANPTTITPPIAADLLSKSDTKAKPTPRENKGKDEVDEQELGGEEQTPDVNRNTPRSNMPDYGSQGQGQNPASQSVSGQDENPLGFMGDKKWLIGGAVLCAIIGIATGGIGFLVLPAVFVGASLIGSSVGGAIAKNSGYSSQSITSNIGNEPSLSPEKALEQKVAKMLGEIGLVGADAKTYNPSKTDSLTKEVNDLSKSLAKSIRISGKDPEQAVEDLRGLFTSTDFRQSVNQPGTGALKLTATKFMEGAKEQSKDMLGFGKGARKELENQVDEMLQLHGLKASETEYNPKKFTGPTSVYTDDVIKFRNELVKVAMHFEGDDRSDFIQNLDEQLKDVDLNRKSGKFNLNNPENQKEVLKLARGLAEDMQPSKGASGRGREGKDEPAKGRSKVPADAKGSGKGRIEEESPDKVSSRSSRSGSSLETSSKERDD